MVRIHITRTCVRYLVVCAVFITTLPSAVLANDGIVNEAIAVARTLYQSENLYDRILGAGTLSDIGDQDALALLEELALGSDIVFQRSAIDTLIGVQHPNGIDLIYRLAAGSPDFTQFLTQSLATNPREGMSDFLLSLLGNSKPLIQQYAIQALVHQNDSDSAIDAVNKKVIAAPDVLLTTRAYGYYFLALKGHGHEIEEELLDVAAGGDLNQREVAAVALRYLDTPASREALAHLQRSSDARVSLAAISSQAALGNEQSIAELLNVIARGKSLNAEVGASALRRLPPELAHELSLKLFALNLRPDPGSRLLESWRAIEWDASEVYAWGLANKNVDVRMQTIWLMGQRQERDRLKELARFLADDNPRIRGMAAWAIVHIAPEQYIPGTKV